MANDSSVLKWVLGGYYFKEDQLAYNAIRSGYNQNVILNHIIGTKALAAFGQATFSVSDQLRVLGGARYTSTDGWRYLQEVQLEAWCGI